MSELIQKNGNRAVIRWKLLTGASVLALSAYVSSAGMANAEDSGRPTVWIELGGQAEQLGGLSAPFSAPFMSITPTPDVYKGISFLGSQGQARYSVGEEGKITLQPEDSDWIFSAGVRYGRSHATRHKHNESQVPPAHYSIPAFGSSGYKYFRSDKLADTLTHQIEQHLVVDFQAGKDVGLGLFGRHGTSTISAGIRYAAFTAKSDAVISARPAVNVHEVSFYGGYVVLPRATFYQYTLSGRAERSFKGIGPSVSWDASAPLVGNSDDGELTFDWGLNAALLFGRQKAKTQHTMTVYHKSFSSYYYHYVASHPAPHHSTRSRSVAVPNLGGFAGLSVKYPNAKISLGYRADFFFGAMDTGIDARRTSDLGFTGPFATISIGLP